MSLTICVVMTAYNAAETIAESIQSVLGQDADDLELLVVDDGSTDETASIVRAFNDARLRFETPGRLGRSAAVNWAIGTTNADFIAINDADDLSLPGRFEDQRRYLAEHPDIDVAGGQMIAFWGERTWPLQFPTRHDDIERELERERMPVAHAGVMLRRDWFVRSGGLDSSLPRMEDFDLYWRNRSKTRFGAVDQAVVKYRFKTLAFSAWSADEDCYDRVIGRSSSPASRALGYVRYRTAIWTQQHGVGVTRRGRTSPRGSD